MAKFAAFFLVILSSGLAMAHPSDYRSVECVAQTYTGTESTLRLDQDSYGRYIGGELTFRLVSGTVNRLIFGAQDSRRFISRDGNAGEMYIAADLVDSRGGGSLRVRYEGNDFTSRLSRGESLYDHFLYLGGDWGHVSYSRSVDANDLGGEISGWAWWDGRRENIHFRNIICGRW